MPPAPKVISTGVQNKNLGFAQTEGRKHGVGAGARLGVVDVNVDS